MEEEVLTTMKGIFMQLRTVLHDSVIEPIRGFLSRLLRGGSTSGQQFCLWLVPSDSGTIRKLRFSARRGIALLFIASVITGAALVVAGDYTRVQIARLRETLSFLSLQSEHAELQSETEMLTSRILALREENRTIELHQLAVLQRLGELNDVLGGLKELALPLDRATRNPAGTLLGSGEQSQLTDIGGRESDPTSESSVVDTGTDPDDEGTGGFETPLNESLTLEAVRSLNPEELSSFLMNEIDQKIEQFRGVPLGFPGNGHVNSEFGPRRSPFSNRARMHHGVDLALPYGSYVLSTAEGTVSSVRRTKSYGLVIDVKHGNGIVTRYAHLSKALVQRGERICRGEVLGLVGNSGMSTGPHLHYEVRVGGKSVDPLPLMLLPSRIELAGLLER
jgi:murein DD-endopeptidase MepM/ murein hydrolase activator NlpD